MDYSPILPFKCTDFNTVFRTVFTNPSVSFERKRVFTPDNDFIDLDFSKVNSKKLFILIHGLEGSSRSKYIRSNAIYFNSIGYDICAMNLRGCSGEPNLLFSSYHSGKTDDLDFVIKNIERDYDEIFLLGYSLGGNLVTKYTGEKGETINSKIKNSIAISVPVDLKSSSVQLAKKRNWIYQSLFMKDLKYKLIKKISQFSISDIDPKDVNSLKNFKQYDDIYTSKAHGFIDAEDYWKRNSCKQFIHNIKIPSLMINASDDSFLGKECYPIEEAKSNPFFTLDIPKYGGHVGFNVSFDKNNYWLEKRIIEFIKD